MSLLSIDGHILKKAIIRGSNNLLKNKELINSLNVFPVPDGDTGTNMSMTILSAAKEVKRINSPSITDVAKALSDGSLRGARGNSGVILSQLFRGFYKGLENIDIATNEDLIRALKKSVEMSYNAVMKPKEGTILTVAKAVYEKAKSISEKTSDIKKTFKTALDHGYTVLEKTTSMLPQLREAGVVDAGAFGLLHILTGFMESIKYKEAILLENITSDESNIIEFKAKGPAEIKFLYCTEFLITGKNFSSNIEKDLKSFLQKSGDSIVLAFDDDIIKAHVHTNNPGIVLDRALKVGMLDSVKIENMSVQHTNSISFHKETENSQPSTPAEIKEIGFVAVSLGDGFKDTLLNLGIDQIIDGGQSMNPSTDDILNAINSTNAKNIFMFPNNKNIILASKQAKELLHEKNVFIIETLNPLQCISSMVAYLPDNSIEDNLNSMTDAISSITTAQITFAVRDTTVNGIKIEKNDFLGIIEDNIQIVEKSLDLACKNLLSSLISKNYDATLLTIYYGNDVTEDDANNLLSYIESTYEGLEVELSYGGQPLYYYLFGIE